MKATVIGAGHGGRAYAAYLSEMGIKVALVYRTKKNISTICKNKAILSRGKIDKIVKLHRVTDDYSIAIRNSKIILIVLPASAHRKIAEEIAPYLQNGQIILLNPGRTWGAVEFKHMVKKANPNVKVYVGETQTLLFTSRKIEDFGVEILEIKKSVQYCFYPERHNERVSSLIHSLFPQMYPVNDIRITSLNNIGMILHPTITLLNAGRIDSGEEFKFYTEGVTRGVANVLKQVDRERLNILSYLGIKSNSMLEWAFYSYNAISNNYYELFQKIEAYKTITAPTTLNHRYIIEDVPTGLVAFSSIGKHLRKPTPTIDSLIQLANVVLNKDFMKYGRTIENCEVPERLLKPIRRIPEQEDPSVLRILNLTYYILRSNQEADSEMEY